MEAYDRLVKLLVKLVEDIAEEVRKAEGGNKAAGTRVRKAMQDVKKAAQDVRVGILDARGDSTDGP
jgi:flagellar biosynthesis/type III secretory pathway protein FliH